MKKIRKSRSPEQRKGKSYDRSNRSSSRDRRSSSEDNDIQEFIKIVTENKPEDDETQKSEF